MCAIPLFRKNNANEVGQSNGCARGKEDFHRHLERPYLLIRHQSPLDFWQHAKPKRAGHRMPDQPLLL